MFDGNKDVYESQSFLSSMSLGPKNKKDPSSQTEIRFARARDSLAVVEKEKRQRESLGERKEMEIHAMYRNVSHTGTQTQKKYRSSQLFGVQVL